MFAGTHSDILFPILTDTDEAVAECEKEEDSKLGLAVGLTFLLTLLLTALLAVIVGVLVVAADRKRRKQKTQEQVPENTTAYGTH